jgi:8-oxo-dGTP pyrophosphatase MutT (NUDIX family)
VDARVQTRVSAYAVAVADERLLLARLSEASPIFTPGLWHLPGGGIEPDEQPMETLARELREETGLELAGARLVDARTYTAHRHGMSWNLTALFYMVELNAGSPAVAETDGTTDAAAWIPITDLLAYDLSPAARDALGMIHANLSDAQANIDTTTAHD